MELPIADYKWIRLKIQDAGKTCLGNLQFHNTETCDFGGVCGLLFFCFSWVGGSAACVYIYIYTLTHVLYRIYKHHGVVLTSADLLHATYINPKPGNKENSVNLICGLAKLRGP